MQRIDGVSVTMAAPVEQVLANIAASTARGLKQVHELSDWREGMPIALVGGGPSLRDTIGEVRKFKNVMVCGSAHDWLVDQGVTPRWCVLCDPDPIMANYVTKSSPGTTYLVASQCSPELFESLYWANVVLWNCGADAETNNSIWGDSQTVIMSGGCTVLSRAVFLAVSFGFSNLHLFGCDTCMNAGHHAYEFSTEAENDTVNDAKWMSIGGPDGRKFLMASYHVGQLFDFKNLLKTIGRRARFTVHGDGALAELMKLGKEAADA
jgi:uncharacterized Rossmann fold enzyme